MSNEGKELMDPSLFVQLLENQRRELTLKEKEIDLEREKIRAAQKSDERQLLYAQQQLEATERDRKDDRAYRQTLESKSLKLFIIFVIAVTAFLIYAVGHDKEQMVIEIFKVIAYGGSFGIGGYAWGRYKRNDDG